MANAMTECITVGHHESAQLKSRPPKTSWSTFCSPSLILTTKYSVQPPVGVTHPQNGHTHPLSVIFNLQLNFLLIPYCVSSLNSSSDRDKNLERLGRGLYLPSLHHQQQNRGVWPAAESVWGFGERTRTGNLCLCVCSFVCGEAGGFLMLHSFPTDCPL